jgi:hypothetical protein
MKKLLLSKAETKSEIWHFVVVTSAINYQESLLSTPTHLRLSTNSFNRPKSKFRFFAVTDRKPEIQGTYVERSVQCTAVCSCAFVWGVGSFL